MQFCYNNALIETELDNVRCVVNAKVNVVLLPNNEHDKHILLYPSCTTRARVVYRSAFSASSARVSVVITTTQRASLLIVAAEAICWCCVGTRIRKGIIICLYCELTDTLRMQWVPGVSVINEYFTLAWVCLFFIDKFRDHAVWFFIDTVAPAMWLADMFA